MKSESELSELSTRHGEASAHTLGRPNYLI